MALTQSSCTQIQISPLHSRHKSTVLMALHPKLDPNLLVVWFNRSRAFFYFFCFLWSSLAEHSAKALSSTLVRPSILPINSGLVPSLSLLYLFFLLLPLSPLPSSFLSRPSLASLSSSKPLGLQPSPDLPWPL